MKKAYSQPILRDHCNIVRMTWSPCFNIQIISVHLFADQPTLSNRDDQRNFIQYFVLHWTTITTFAIADGIKLAI